MINQVIQLCCQVGSVGATSGVKWGDNMDPCPLKITELLEDTQLELIIGKDMVPTHPKY